MLHLVREQLRPWRRLDTLRRRLDTLRFGCRAVEIRNAGLGYFAHLEWVLELLAHEHFTGERFRVRLTSPQYVTPERGTDFLRYAFESREPEPVLPERFWQRVLNIEDIRLPRMHDAEFTFQLAHDLFFKRFALRDDVAREVETVRQKLFGERPFVGVHFRGTDKVSEAARVEYDQALSAVDDLLERHPEAGLFVATDESRFLEACIRRYGQRAGSLTDHRRSEDDKPVHLAPTGDGYLLSRDALLNCLMLTHCVEAIKTASILSAWAKVLNPGLPISTLSRRNGKHSYFPERLIPDYLPARR